jgi:hypothetical protein
MGDTEPDVLFILYSLVLGHASHYSGDGRVITPTYMVATNSLGSKDWDHCPSRQLSGKKYSRPTSTCCRIRGGRYRLHVKRGWLMKTAEGTIYREMVKEPKGKYPSGVRKVRSAACTREYLDPDIAFVFPGSMATL